MLTRYFPLSEGRSSGPLFPARERPTQLFPLFADTAVLFAIQKRLETS